MAIRTEFLRGGFDADLALLEYNVPGSVEGANTYKSERPRPRGQLRCKGLEHMPTVVRPNTEQDLKKENGCPCRPGLRARGRRIRDREGCLGPREAGEHLRQLVVEVARGVEHSPDDPQRLRPTAVACEAPRDQGVVVGPHGPVVVPKGVVPRVRGRHRADPPARPEVLSHQLVDDGVGPLRQHDPAPEEVADVRGERVDAALFTVEPERVEAAALLAPEGAVELPAQPLRLLLEPRREPALAPHFSTELRRAAFRVVDVALNLARRDRRLGKGAVVEELRVVRVLPRLVHEPALRAATVLDEAVA